MNLNPKLSFTDGLLCLPKGLKEILFDYKIFLYTIIPILIGLALIYLGFYFGWDWSSEFVKKQMIHFLGHWISEKGYVFKIIFSMFNFIAKILFTVMIIYVGFILIQIISIPFYSLSCERILTKRDVFPKRDFDLGIWIRLNIRLFVISIIRMAIFLFFGIIVFIISFIPGLQFFAMMYSGYVMALDCIDYTLEIYEMNLGRRIGVYFGDMRFFMGLGSLLIPSLFVPGLTLILLPIAVVGTAVCFAEKRGRQEYENLIA